MLVTTNNRTCPEDDGSLPDHVTAAAGGNLATCSSPNGFIANATSLRVTCRVDWPALGVGRWLYIYSGANYAGWYVADFTITENTESLPGC